MCRSATKQIIIEASTEHFESLHSYLPLKYKCPHYTQAMSYDRDSRLRQLEYGKKFAH